jgi:antitoxin HicB
MMTKKDLKYYLNLPYKVVFYPAKEGGYVVEIPGLPGCISQGETVEEALEMIQDAKKLWLETAIEDNIEIPKPSKGVDEYSGKINLRMPKSLHKTLAEKANEEKISLNQYINYQLSRGIKLRDSSR